MTARVALLLRGLAVLVAVLLVVTLGARHVPVVPDLVLVLVVAWALLRGPVAGAAVGLAAGWLLDLVPARLVPPRRAGPDVRRRRSRSPVGRASRARSRPRASPWWPWARR